MKKTPSYIDPERIVPIARSSTNAFKTGTWSNRRPIHTQKVSPCSVGCPAGNSIPRALLKASQDDIDAALGVFLEENPFPGVCGSICYHPCESSCNRASWDGAVNIRALELAASEHGQWKPEPLTDEGAHKPVAVVGSGPAGLSAAYHLARLGHPVTVLEAEKEVGGLLRWGIPEFRLDPRVVAGDLNRILSLNIHVTTGTRVDVQGLEELTATHEAVFLAVGAPASRRLEVPGADLGRVLSGLDFLSAARRHAHQGFSGKVLVIGGGNVAVDAALSALRLGAQEVIVACLERPEQMPAHAEEYELARGEGIVFHHGWAPRKISEAYDGLRLEFVKCVAVLDEQGMFNPVCDESTGLSLDAHWVIQAIGQEPDPSGLTGSDSLRTGDIGSFRINSTSMETSVSGIFAGGDAVNSPGSVVEAIADGKRAAAMIHFRLCGRELSLAEHKAILAGGPAFSIQSLFRPRDGWNPSTVVEFRDLEPLFLDRRPRVELSVREPGLRNGGFETFVRPIARETVLSEASRCFFCGTCSSCDRCFLFCPEMCISPPDGGTGSYVADPDYCKGCSVCAAVCPRGVMSMGEAQ